jgi:hypothetical protein
MSPPRADTVLASLYVHAGTGPFSAYPKNLQFEHGKEQAIAVFPPTTPSGSTCKMAEDRWPASFYSASVVSPSGERGKFGTGSGDETGRLLAALCEAFQEGAACLTLDEFEGREELVDLFYAKEDGRTCSIRSDLHSEWHSIELGERQRWNGQKMHAVSFFVKDETLARALAAAVGSGMLCFERVYP